MTRKQLLQALHDKHALDLMPYTLEHMVTSRQIPTPGLNLAGRRVYEARHIRAILDVLRVRRERGQVVSEDPPMDSEQR